MSDRLKIHIPPSWIKVVCHKCKCSMEFDPTSTTLERGGYHKICYHEVNNETKEIVIKDGHECDNCFRKVLN